MSERREIVFGRASLAGCSWAFAWWIAAIALSFKLAELATPAALNSRFFFMWAFARAIYYGLLGVLAGALFVVAEDVWHHDRTRQSSAAGWVAIGLGALSGIAAVGISIAWRWLVHDEAMTWDPLPVTFGAVVGAVCGVMTFLAVRTKINRAARKSSQPT